MAKIKLLAVLSLDGCLSEMNRGIPLVAPPRKLWNHGNTG